MGMFTDFCFDARLKRDCPTCVVNVLGYMFGEVEIEEIPKHEFFQCESWACMAHIDCCYFDGVAHSGLHEELGEMRINIRCQFKNYHDEISKFIDWITPYLDKYPGDFLGFYRYEETEEPTLIFYGKKSV